MYKIITRLLTLSVQESNNKSYLGVYEKFDFLM